MAAPPLPRPPTASRRRGGLFHEGRLPLWRAAASPPSPPRPTSLPLRRAAASSTPRLPRPRPRSPSPRVSGSRDGLQPPLYSTSELRSGPSRRRCPWPRARRRRPGPPSFGGGRPAAERAWRPGASPPGRAQRSRGAPRCASGAALGFRRPACSPLAVVASELTLGAMAYEGRGRGGRAVTQGPQAPARLLGGLGRLALSKATNGRGG